MSDADNQLQAQQPASSAAIVPVEGGNMELSAQSPREMIECHSAMILWCQRKIEVIRNEALELRAAFKHAVERKWKSTTLKRHAELAEKRVVFYEKMKTALDAGYYIVPNFPVTLFAIRTDEEKPKSLWARLENAHQRNFEQSAKQLPHGQGEYKNPQPVVRQSMGDPVIEKTTYGQKTTYPFWADSWDMMEFPANMARIHVMEAVSRATSMKLFDEIGFLPEDRRRNPDPILIGRLIDPRPKAYGPQVRVSFMIAWHIDTRTL